jgi:hypothetical protein
MRCPACDPNVGSAFATKMKTYFDKCSGVLGRAAANLITLSGCPSTNNATESNNRRDKKILVTCHGLLMHLPRMVAVTNQLSTKYSTWYSIMRRDVWSQQMRVLVYEYLAFQVHPQCPTAINVILCGKEFDNFPIQMLDPTRARVGGELWKLPDDLTTTARHVLILADTKCLRQLMTHKCSAEERPRVTRPTDIRRLLWGKTPGEEDPWGQQFVDFVQHPELYEDWGYEDCMSWCQSFYILVAFEAHEEEDMMSMLRRFERGIPAEASGHNTNGATVHWSVLAEYRENGGKVFRCLCGDFLLRTCCLHVLSHLTHFQILTVPSVFNPWKLNSSQRPTGRKRLIEVGEALSTSMTGPLLVDPDDDDFKETKGGEKRTSRKRTDKQMMEQSSTATTRGCSKKRLKSRPENAQTQCPAAQRGPSTKCVQVTRTRGERQQDTAWEPTARRSPRVLERTRRSSLEVQVPTARAPSSRASNRVLSADLETVETWTGELSQVLRDTFERLQSMRREQLLTEMRDMGRQCCLHFEQGARGWSLRNAGKTLKMGEVASILSYGPVCDTVGETGVPPGQGVVGWACRTKDGRNVTKYQGWSVDGWVQNKCGLQFGGAANEGSSKSRSNAEILLVKPSTKPDEWYSVITATTDIGHDNEILVWYGDDGTGWTHRFLKR